MRLEEALEKDGRVELLGYGSAYRDSDGVLKWRDNNMPVPVYLLIRDKWLYYTPKPEKCPACQEADEIEQGHDFLSLHVISRYCKHLREFHCTCK